MTTFASEIELINASGLFDADWYLSKYVDVAINKVDPIFHYLTVGADLLRDPSSQFDTSFYRSSNPDVMHSAVNPLLHYIQFGIKEGRAPLPVKPVKDAFAEAVDIVVPVFNALEDVQHCLRAIESHQDGFRVRAIVVNDGSNEATTEWLRSFCASRELFQLIEHDGNKGYTRAVNTGLQATTAPYAITLNSDTIVTHGWLKGLVRCVNTSPKLGIVGPLSNAASWQNVPELFDETGSFAINALPPGVGPDEMAQIVARGSKRAYPRTPFVNGFCFLIKRAVIDAIGFMDEQNFPVGYGEENDFCIRAADAGFSLAIADDVYVFHAKSKSFGHSKRKELSQQGSASLKRKHTAAKFDALVKQVKDIQALEPVRKAVQRALMRRQHKAADPVDLMSMRVLFLLPVRGGGGGSHSVVQEVSAMRSYGVAASIAVKMDDRQRFLDLYGDIPNAEDLFVGFDGYTLIDLAFDYDIAIGTIFSSMQLIKQMAEVNPRLLPAYYVQDYEPMFFPQGTDNWKTAFDSYTLVPEALLFAKTDWIISQVHTHHGVLVHKVSPSIDHSVYRPQPRKPGITINIAAMIRPQTPVRGADRTMRLLRRVAAAHGERVAFHLFGCDSESPMFQELDQTFSFTNYGELKRSGVTSLLGQSDIFVDLSDYQAFGRTALEAMACGCTAMVPVHGGTDEYAIDGVNALVVDTFDEEACFARLDALLRAPAQVVTMKHAGLLTAARYSVGSAALSELVLFAAQVGRHCSTAISTVRRRLVLIPSLTRPNKAGMRFPTGSAYVRMLTPYLNSAVRSSWHVEVAGEGQLPEPGSAEIAMLQRDVNGISLEELQQWHREWRAAGGRIFLEIDDDLFDPETLGGRTGVDDIRQITQKVRWLAAQAELIIVSTPQLAETAARYNSNIKIVPNYLDALLWRLDRPRNHQLGTFARGVAAPVVLGYIGTPSHVDDVKIIEDVMRRLQAEYGNRIAIEVIGVFQNTPPTFGTRIPLPSKSDYRNFVEWLQQRVHWDIGVIPLVDNTFNRSKSNLKFLEYGALNMAVVCSDVDSYRDVVRHEENALVVPNQADAWYIALKQLIDNEALRHSLADRARSEVVERFTIQANTDIYLSTLASNKDA